MSDEPKTTGVIYSYSDRKNGWYCYRHDTNGNQIGSAEYVYHKADVIKIAKQIAAEHGVKAVRA